MIKILSGNFNLSFRKAYLKLA